MRSKPRLFRRLLVANRGEIAVRVIRACRDLGIETVAVFSDADRCALHVQFADVAVRIGPAPATESYLVIDRIIDAARQTGAEAIHPGYGFLAENADFATRCEKAGLVFVGPPPAAIAKMGDKVTAREVMKNAGVPVVPGSEGVLQEEKEVLAVAQALGYPVVLKASAGGGGKGMRLVAGPAEIKSALRAVRSEARTAFGDDRIYLEKFVVGPRHVEFQVLADRHGHTIHLFERECSVQRRHQKVIEESPSPALDARMRAEMGAVAVKAAASVGYVGAGTIEFLVGADRSFYFLEMNTRIQVEHPLTELVTGVDLVKAQIEIAAGFPLNLRQDQITQVGHAIECRIYAEDPVSFFPSPGKIEELQVPGGTGIRNDSGVYQGAEVPVHYDPMISKFLAWGRNRDEALARMARGLAEYRVRGVATNLPFHRWVLSHPRFRSGQYDTNFVSEEYHGLEGAAADGGGELAEVAAIAAALAAWGRRRRLSESARGQRQLEASRWRDQARREAVRE